MVDNKNNKIQLTERELQVLKLISKGLSTKEISSELNITTNTVNTYRKRIPRKLEVRNCTEAVYLMSKYELI